MRYELKDLIGKTLTEVEYVEDEIRLLTTEGDKFTLVYLPDCCASCNITDVAGDLQDLVGTPIVMAEEVDNLTDDNETEDESYTWTFMKFRTAKGDVTITWYGSSNGYYSESPSVLKNDTRWDY